MAFVYNRESGKLIEVNDADPALHKNVAEGKWAFPKDLEVPVIDQETGEIGTIPSEKAQEAFQQGFRPSTIQDTSAAAAKNMEQLKADAYDDPVLAGTTAAVNEMSFGLSNQILKNKGAGEAVEQLKERSPTANLVGSLAGAAANPLLGAAGTAAKLGTIGKIGAAAQAGSKAAKIVESASPLLGSMAEGAVYGLHGGLTEGALGNPHDMAENILLGGALGGVGGLLFHGGEATAPYIKGISTKGTGLATGAVEAGAQKTADLVGSTALKMRGAGELVPEFKAMVADTSGRGALEAMGGVKGAEKLEAEAERGLNQLSKEQSGIHRDLDRMIQQAPKEEAAALKEVVAQHKGDLAAISDDLNGSMVQMYQKESPLLSADARLDPTHGELIKAAQELAESLRGKGTSQLKTLADDINAVVEANKGVTLGDTYNLRNSIKEILPKSSEGLGAVPNREARNEIMNFLYGPETKEFDQLANRFVRDAADSPMYRSGAGHAAFPDYAEKIAGMDAAYKSVKDFDRLLEGNTGKAGKLISALTSPQGKMVLGTLPDRVPEIEAILAKTESAVERKAALDGAVASFNDMAARSGGMPITSDQYLKIIEDLNLAGKIKPDAMEKLKALDGLDPTKANSPIDRWIQVQRALGNDVSPMMKKLAEADPTYRTMKKLQDMPEWKSKILDAGAKYGYFAGPKVGAAFSVVNNLAGTIANPVSTLAILSKVERAANAGIRLIDTTINKSVDMLFSQKGRQGALSDAAKELGSMKQQKEAFPKQVENIGLLTNPQTAADIIASKTANLHVTPNVAAALGAKTIEIASFLQTKMPQDPLAGYNLPGIKSNWEPSDAQLSTFNRYVNSAQDPKSVIENVGNGTVSPEEVETLKTLNPNIYQKLQTKILNDITTKGQDLSYQQKITLGTLFQIPTDVSLTPEFIVGLQQTFAQQQQTENQGGRPEGKSIKIDLDPMKNIATETTRITNK